MMQLHLLINSALLSVHAQPYELCHCPLWNNTTTNLSEAQSRIQETADYATEVSNMSKAQIIQQAGNTVLAKADQYTTGSVSAAGLIVVT